MINAVTSETTTVPPPGTHWRLAWLDLASFALSLLLAWLRQWQTADLVWSLWLSSLVVGYTTIAVNLVRARRNVVVMLIFLTCHFGLFHFVHSIFLNVFFPIVSRTAFVDSHVYLEVVRRYWGFLPMAFLAERDLLKPAASGPAASAALAAPYKNVFRMHVLIFFFLGMYVARIQNFAVYAVVYAVYFFPWRQATTAGGDPSASRARAWSTIVKMTRD